MAVWGTVRCKAVLLLLSPSRSQGTSTSRMPPPLHSDMDVAMAHLHRRGWQRVQQQRCASGCSGQIAVPCGAAGCSRGKHWDESGLTAYLGHVAFALAAQHLHCPSSLTVRGLPFWPWWPGRDRVVAMGSWQPAHQPCPWRLGTFPPAPIVL